jgi:hypothetical protein
MPAIAPKANLPDFFETQWSGVTPLSISRANPWLSSAQQKISELAQLPENWDSYGSPPVQQPAIEQAADLVACLSRLDLPDPQIFPVPGGGIQLELQQRQRELELEILPDGSIEYLLVAKGSEMLEGSIPSSSKGDIYRLVYWLQGELAGAFQF